MRKYFEEREPSLVDFIIIIIIIIKKYSFGQTNRSIDSNTKAIKANSNRNTRDILV